MKRFVITVLASILLLSPLLFASSVHASPGFTQHMAGSIAIGITGVTPPEGSDLNVYCGDLSPGVPQNLAKYLTGECEEGVGMAGLLPTTGRYLSLLYQEQPSSREYIANIIDNIGLPQVSSAYAQGTGYQAMTPFLSFWQGFRNLAYSLYIIMFVVIGVMIMLRTKVNAQTVITIQAALPNLIITLLLITFSYAIVGFMIDLMYFLIYFLVYLVSATGIISGPNQAIDRLLSYPAWSVIFEGRNSIISGIAIAISDILIGLNGVTQGVSTLTGGITDIFANSFFYLLVAIWLAITMLKLMWLLIKSYVMLIVQTVTAPVQILLNALPGSKAFSEWLKKTASYLLPFPVAAAMFILSAVFIGDPTEATLFGDPFGTGSANPFGINLNSPFYSQGDDLIWLPPFTLNNYGVNSADIMVIIGFFIFTMTPAVVKMAQDWLQVKESPYTSEVTAGLGQAFGLMQYPGSLIGGVRRQQEQVRLAKNQARWNAEEFKRING